MPGTATHSSATLEKLANSNFMQQQPARGCSLSPERARRRLKIADHYFARVNSLCVKERNRLVVERVRRPGGRPFVMSERNRSELCDTEELHNSPLCSCLKTIITQV